MQLDYKIERKPATWHIELENKYYSDQEKMHLFIQANTDEEAFYFLQEYFKKVGTHHNLLSWKEGETIKARVSLDNLTPETEIDWDFKYGNTWLVSIKPLEIIHFHKVLCPTSQSTE